MNVEWERPFIADFSYFLFRNKKKRTFRCFVGNFFSGYFFFEVDFFSTLQYFVHIFYKLFTAWNVKCRIRPFFLLFDFEAVALSTLPNVVIFCYSIEQ